MPHWHRVSKSGQSVVKVTTGVCPVSRERTGRKALTTDHRPLRQLLFTNATGDVIEVKGAVCEFVLQIGGNWGGQGQ